MFSFIPSATRVDASLRTKQTNKAVPQFLYMLCDIIYKILNIFDMIFDCSTSVNFVALKSKTIVDLSYVIYTRSIEDLNHHM